MTELTNYTTPTTLFITDEYQAFHMLGYALSNDLEIVSYTHSNTFVYEDVYADLKRLIDTIKDGWYKNIIVYDRSHIMNVDDIESYATLHGVSIFYVLQDEHSITHTTYENTLIS